MKKTEQLMEVANTPIVEQLEEVKMDNASVQTSHPDWLADDSADLGANFANAGELLKSYKSLHAEFTRKSQELSDLKKITAQGNASVADEKPTPLMQQKVDKVQSPIHLPPVIGMSAHVPRTIGGVKTLRDSDMLAKQFFATKS